MADIMYITKRLEDSLYAPTFEHDLPLFRHFCEGMIAVVDIKFFKPVFKLHGWDYVVKDEAEETVRFVGESEEAVKTDQSDHF